MTQIERLQQERDEALSRDPRYSHDALMRDLCRPWPSEDADAIEARMNELKQAKEDALARHIDCLARLRARQKALGYDPDRMSDEDEERFSWGFRK